MYRIQLSPGTETTYQTIDEFIRAVTVGEVTPDSLIFHRKSERWLPVTRHPHYQHALSVQPAPASRPRPTQPPPRAPERESPPSPAAQAPRQLQIPRVDNAVQPRKVFPANGQDQKVDASELDQLLSLLGSQDAPASATPEPPEEPPAPAGRPDDDDHLKANGNGNGRGPTGELHRPAPPPEPPPPSPAPPASAAPSSPPEPPPAAPSLPPSPPQVESGPEMRQPAPTQETPRGPSGKAVNLPRMEPPPPPKRLDVVSDLAPLPDTRPAEPVKVERVEHSRRVSAPQAVPVELAEPIRSGGRRSIAKAVAAAIGLALTAATLMVWRPWDRSGAQASEAPPPEQHASLAGSESRQQPETPLSSVPAPRQDLPADSARVAVPAPAGTPASAVAPAPAAAATDSLIAKPQILPPTANALAGTAAMTANLSGIETRLPLSPSELKRHYVASYGVLRQTLETAGTRAGFSRLLTPERMSSGDALASSRQSLTAAAIAIREYRSGESRTERAYQDTLGLVGKRLGLSAGELTAWGPNPTLKEDGETARLVDVMMAQADGIFGLLLTQQGQYQFSGDAIVFTDSETARRYGMLRSTLAQQVQRWSETPANRVPVTVAFLLKGLGKVQLPTERSATP